MTHRVKVILVIVLSILLVAGIWVAADRVAARKAANVPQETTEAPSDPAESRETGEASLPTGQSEESSDPTEIPGTEVTEPQEQQYVLSFAGDCTTGSDPKTYWYESSFIQTIGEDYSFPFKLVREYFEADDFTMVNLETALTKDGAPADKLFTFKGPTAYTEIFTGSSVEAVTLANNHSMDYGETGYRSTVKALQEAGLPYVEKNGTAMVTTDSGLKIGLYGGCFDFSVPDMQKKIGQLRADGAEIVVAAFHWGVEGSYRSTSNQEYFGRAAIDAGADIVYGTHPHVLQKIEKYGNGVILYSLGNFSFGGNPFPKDYDSAIVQVQVIRGLDGKLRVEDTTAIPVLFSSMKGQNNYQPMPVEKGTPEYDRIMSKLDGTFTGPDLVVNYGTVKPTNPPVETVKPTTPTDTIVPPTESTQPTEATRPTEPDVPATTPPAPTEAPPASTEAPPASTEAPPPETQAPAPTEPQVPAPETPAPPPSETPAPPAEGGGE